MPPTARPAASGPADQHPAPDWPGEWLRGVLSLCTLQVLSHGATYGYEIAQRLAAAGLGDIKGGTLYPLLGRLHSAGYLDEEWRPGDGGPGRKYYALTDAGRTHLAVEGARWVSFAELTCDFIAPPQDRQDRTTPRRHQPTPAGRTAPTRAVREPGGSDALLDR